MLYPALAAWWGAAIRSLALTRNVDLTGVSLEIAGFVIGILYGVAHISGGHINTAVTFMFGIKGIFPMKWVPIYWAFQLIGSIIGGGLILAFYGPQTGALSVNMYSPKAVPDYT